MTVRSTMRSSEDVLTLYLCARVRWWRCVCTTVGLNVEERVNDLADSKQGRMSVLTIEELPHTHGPSRKACKK